MFHREAIGAGSNRLIRVVMNSFARIRGTGSQGFIRTVYSCAWMGLTISAVSNRLLRVLNSFARIRAGSNGLIEVVNSFARLRLTIDTGSNSLIRVVHSFAGIVAGSNGLVRVVNSFAGMKIMGQSRMKRRVMGMATIRATNRLVRIRICFAGVGRRGDGFIRFIRQITRIVMSSHLKIVLVVTARTLGSKFNTILNGMMMVHWSTVGREENTRIKVMTVGIHRGIIVVLFK
jgi:hypothetical protein